MNSEMNNENTLYECCVCYDDNIPNGWINKCRTCVGALCHTCYCELEYGTCYSLVTCPMCRTTMMTEYIHINFVSNIIQDWCLRDEENDLPVIKLLFKNIHPDSENLCHDCNNWEDKCSCEK